MQLAQAPAACGTKPFASRSVCVRVNAGLAGAVGQQAPNAYSGAFGAVEGRQLQQAAARSVRVSR